MRVYSNASNHFSLMHIYTTYIKEALYHYSLVEESQQFKLLDIVNRVDIDLHFIL